jgi:glycosyltransferase involved in cell wall biosynthesis
VISVITITYNRKHLLKEAIESVLSQSFTDFEYIIVDDGSTDDTCGLVNTFSDPRIRYIQNAHTGYLSINRNTGVENATGEVIAFLDSDDYWDKKYLEEINAVYKNKNVNSVITNAFVFNSEQTKSLMPKQTIGLLTGNLLEQKLKNHNFKVCSCCFSFLRKLDVRFNPELKCGDTDFYLRTLSLGNSYVLLKELAYIRQHDSNMTGKETFDSLFIQAYNEEFVTLNYLKAKALISDKLYKKTYSFHLYRQAHNLMKIGMKVEARRRYLEAFKKYPFNVKALFKIFG